MRSSQAETLSNQNSIQPPQQELTSTLVQVDGKNAAAGKMAPNTAPMKGEKLTILE